MVAWGAPRRGARMAGGRPGERKEGREARLDAGRRVRWRRAEAARPKIEVTRHAIHVSFPRAARTHPMQEC